MSLNESFNIINFSLVIKKMLITENLEGKIYLKKKPTFLYNTEMITF